MPPGGQVRSWCAPQGCSGLYMVVTESQLSCLEAFSGKFDMLLYVI